MLFRLHIVAVLKADQDRDHVNLNHLINQAGTVDLIVDHHKVNDPNDLHLVLIVIQHRSVHTQEEDQELTRNHLIIHRDLEVEVEDTQADRGINPFHLFTFL